MTLILIYKPSYGQDRFYPNCYKGESLLKLTGKKCFDKQDIMNLTAAGFEIEITLPNLKEGTK